jgi:hypothetical protein
MKIAVNRCHGGFSLSEEAYKELGLEWDEYGYAYEYSRTAPELIACIEKLGEKANGRYAEIEIIEIPDDIKWYIDEYDGKEIIHEVHRSW